MTQNDLHTMAIKHGHGSGGVILEHGYTVWLLVPAQPSDYLIEDVERCRPAGIRVEVDDLANLDAIVANLVNKGYIQGFKDGDSRWWHRFAWWR